MSQPVGIIAGQGVLPVLTAKGIRAAGRPVVCVGLRDQFAEQLPDHCDEFVTAGIIQLGRWIRQLRRRGAAEAAMVGRVGKTRVHDPLRLVRHLPDWRAARVWFWRLRHDKRNQTLLKAVADELASGGITLIDTTQYVPDHLADEGVMGARRPPSGATADIEFARPIIARLCEVQIGQSLAVKDRDVIAVEAVEGTDAMIRRAGALCRSGGWTLVKAAGPDKDPRFDMPTIGVQTIERLAAANAGCLAVEAGRVILLDKARVLAAADAAAIAVVGVRLEKGD
jgi:hypothetical protein